MWEQHPEHELLGRAGHMIKNVACAWRQLIVLFSLADASEQARVLAHARASLPSWPVAWAGKFERVLPGSSSFTPAERAPTSLVHGDDSTTRPEPNPAQPPTPPPRRAPDPR